MPCVCSLSEKRSEGNNGVFVFVFCTLSLSLSLSLFLPLPLRLSFSLSSPPPLSTPFSASKVPGADGGWQRSPRGGPRQQERAAAGQRERRPGGAQQQQAEDQAPAGERDGSTQLGAPLKCGLTAVTRTITGTLEGARL